MLHGSGTWSLKRENELALNWREVRIRWICGMKLRDKLTCIEIRQWLGIEDIVQVIKRNIMRLYGHVIRKDDDDWVKKCVTLEVEGARQRDRRRKMWKELWTRMRMICT